MAREMKNSGVEWIGRIPKDWTCCKQKYLITLLNGRAYQEGEFEEDGKYKVLRVGNLFTNPIWYTSSLELEPNKYCQNGDLLYSWSMSYAPVIWHGEKVIYHYHIWKTILSEKISKMFAYYYLISLTNALRSEVHETTMGFITMGVMNNANIAFPPLSEQQAIANFLDTKCAEIDGLLSDLDAEVKTLAEYKKSIIAETVTRGLNPNVPMKKSGIPWVGEMPSHWKVIANKYIMHKKKEIVPIYEGQDIISLSMNGVIIRDLDAGGKMPTTFNGYQRIYPGNLLMCLFDIDVTPRCIGLIKNDGLTSPAYSQFVMDGDAYAPYYYYFYLKMDNDKELVHLSKNMRHSLNEEQFGMIKTILPPKEEQKAIATYLDEKCAAIEQSIADKQTQIETLKSYKASLIYEYVTGKKQVI